MRVNGIDVYRYTRSHNRQVIDGTIQFLQAFGCCGELLEVLARLDNERLDKQRIAAEEKTLEKWDEARRLEEESGCKEKKEKKVRQIPQEKRSLTTVVGFCPRCKSHLLGEPLPGCETTKSGRVFYKECSACTYYSEIFKKRNKYLEVEGG